MAAPKLKYAIGNSASTTLSSGFSSSDTSAPLTSDTNFNAKSGEGMVLVNESGATEEIAYATTKAGGALSIPLANRGLEGGSAATHNSGETVKGIMTAGMWNDMVDTMLNLFNQTTGAIDTTQIVTPTGTQTLTNKTLTSPTVNSGTINTARITGNYDNWVDATDGATITFNLASGNKQRVTLGGNRTLALSNVQNGHTFILRLKQDATGSRTVTWFSTITWFTSGGTPPTLTTTANKTDTFGFVQTGANTYDGYVIGQGG